MRYRLFPALFVCFLAALFANAQTVNEAESSLVLDNKSAVASIVIDNLERSFVGVISLKLLDEKNTVLAQGSKTSTIKGRNNAYQVPFDIGELL